MESPDDGPGWWRAKMWPLLERANERGFDRVLTVTSSVTSQFSFGSGVTIFDIFSDCGDGPTDCELNLTHEPALDATFLGVSAAAPFASSFETSKTRLHRPRTSARVTTR